jgi:hypothetical protein
MRKRMKEVKLTANTDVMKQLRELKEMAVQLRRMDYDRVKATSAREQELSLELMDGVTITAQRVGLDGWRCSIETSSPDSVRVTQCDCGCTLTVMGKIDKENAKDAGSRSGKGYANGGH